MSGIEDIVPVNKAHRQRLKRLKTNLEKLKARHNLEDRISRIESEVIQDHLAGTRELAQLRIAIGEEIRDALFESAGEQTALLHRIVEKVQTP